MSAQSTALRGFQSPLGFYPSVVLPICALPCGALVAIEGGGCNWNPTPLPSDAQFTALPETHALRSEFDPTRYGLFAYSESDVVAYELSSSTRFFAHVLRQPTIQQARPEARISIARLASSRRDFLRAVADCVRSIQGESKRAALLWYESVRSPSASGSSTHDLPDMANLASALPRRVSSLLSAFPVSPRPPSSHNVAADSRLGYFHVEPPRLHGNYFGARFLIADALAADTLATRTFEQLSPDRRTRRSRGLSASTDDSQSSHLERASPAETWVRWENEYLTACLAAGTSEEDALLQGRFNAWVHDQPTDALDDWQSQHPDRRERAHTLFNGALAGSVRSLVWRVMARGSDPEREILLSAISNSYAHGLREFVLWSGAAARVRRDRSSAMKARGGVPAPSAVARLLSADDLRIRDLMGLIDPTDSLCHFGPASILSDLAAQLSTVTPTCTRTVRGLFERPTTLEKVRLWGRPDCWRLFAETVFERCGSTKAPWILRYLAHTPETEGVEFRFDATQRSDVQSRKLDALLLSCLAARVGGDAMLQGQRGLVVRFPVDLIPASRPRRKAADDRPYSVLLVEDSAPVLQVLIEIVSRIHGVVAYHATTAIGALRIAERRRISAVVSDLVLPDQDGLELLTKIRAIRPACSLVVISGAEDRLSRARESLGASASYLRKPFAPDALRETIRSAMALESRPSA